MVAAIVPAYLALVSVHPILLRPASPYPVVAVVGVRFHSILAHCVVVEIPVHSICPHPVVVVVVVVVVAAAAAAAEVSAHPIVVGPANPVQHIT